jgi:AraC-like DNA-binding protein
MSDDASGGIPAAGPENVRGKRHREPGREAQSIAEPGDERVPLVRWGPETIERRHLFEAWHEAARPLVDTAPVGPERSFSGGGEVAKVGNLLATRMYFDPQRFARSRRHIGDTDAMSLQFYARGGFIGTRAGLPHDLAPDRIALIDFGHEHYGMPRQPSEVLGVNIPRDLIDPRLFRRQPVVTWFASSAPGRLLIGGLCSLHRDLRGIRAARAAEMSAGLVGLINGLLGSHREVSEPGLVRQAKLAAIERYIDRHLHDRQLGPAALARAFGCSRGRLYQLFREHGGVDHYIRERRLGRCFRELAAAEPGATRVWMIAERWGFDDPSHFHRLFKQRFGLRPSEVLTDARARTASEPPQPTMLGDQVRQVHAWFRSL